MAGMNAHYSASHFHAVQVSLRRFHHASHPRPHGSSMPVVKVPGLSVDCKEGAKAQSLRVSLSACRNDGR